MKVIKVNHLPPKSWSIRGTFLRNAPTQNSPTITEQELARLSKLSYLSIPAPHTQLLSSLSSILQFVQIIQQANTAPARPQFSCIGQDAGEPKTRPDAPQHIQQTSNAILQNAANKYSHFYVVQKVKDTKDEL